MLLQGLTPRDYFVLISSFLLKKMLMYIVLCAVSSGLRKLEAFFGTLITVMAISFGYEVNTSCFFGPSYSLSVPFNLCIEIQHVYLNMDHVLTACLLSSCQCVCCDLSNGIVLWPVVSIQLITTSSSSLRFLQYVTIPPKTCGCKCVYVCQ